MWLRSRRTVNLFIKTCKFEKIKKKLIEKPQVLPNFTKVTIDYGVFNMVRME